MFILRRFLVLFGRIAVEWLSVLAWNLYPDYCGILIRFPVESLSGLVWNIHMAPSVKG